MRDLVIVSNRVSVPQAGSHQAGGLAVAINNALASHGGIWFGWNGDIRDTQESAQCIQRGDITYATLPLLQQEYDEYYLGFSNEVLWPIFHLNLGAMNFHRRFADTYYATNARFASEIAPLLKGNELIWVHDYHLIPLGNALRRRGVDSPIGFFLHIPFPSTELLRCIPDHQRLLIQFFDYDLLGFQTSQDREAFREATTRILGATVKGDVVFYGDRRVRLGTYPVGVDVDTLQQESQHSETKRTIMRLRASLGQGALIAGADRLDYSKGLSARLTAIQELLDQHPQYRGKMLYTQVASPSRCAINEYDELRQKLETQAGHINGLYSDLGWAPVHYINKTYPRSVLMGLFRAARIGLVTPVRDGMNLVCKEFVAAQDHQDPGVLVLSEFAGAAQELDGALLVNPYDPHTITQALHRALQMPQEERRQRHASMLKNLSCNSLAQWWQRFIEDLQPTVPHPVASSHPVRRNSIG